MQSFEDGDDDLLTCSLQHFRIDYERPWKDTQFNQLAKSIFVQSLLAAYKGGQYSKLRIPEQLLTASVIGTVLDNHMEYRRKSYRQYSKTQDTKVLNQVRKRRAMNARRLTVSGRINEPRSMLSIL